MRGKSGLIGICALLVAAISCTPTGEEPSVATTTSTTTTTPLTAAQAAAAFQSCLGEQGIVVPDLSLDEEGRPDLSTLADSLDPSSDAWQAGLTACARVITSNGALVLSDDLELADAIVARLMAFSTCMRGQGVEAFPDPPLDFDGTSAPFPVSAIPVGDPELGPATEACALAAGERVPR